MYQLITSAKGYNELSVGFSRCRGRRKEDLNNNKNIKGKYHLTIMLKDVFGYAEHQEESTFGLGNNLTLSKNKDDAVTNITAGFADARIKIGHIHWSVPH